MHLAQAFADSARRHPDKVAIHWGDTTFSYRQVEEQSHAVAGQLRQGRGVQPGDRVGLWMKNRPEFVPAVLGILRAGGVLVPINNFLKPDEVSYILGDAEARVLITDADLMGHIPALRQARPGLEVIQAEDAEAWAGAESAHDWPERAQGDLAVLIYTSGTTGRPKGAMLSHGNLLHNVESCQRILEHTPADRMAVILPLFHSYMLTVGLLLPLLGGGSMVLVRSLSPLKSLIEELLSKRPTILPAIPQFYRGLTSAPIKVPLPIRVFISGSAPLPVQVLKEFEDNFGVPLLEGYGLSEASPVVSKNPLRGVRKPGSIGLPIPNVEMSVQDDQGHQLGPDAVGEICVRGGNVMLGYWNQPEESAKVLRNGWLLTGDIGYRDADGYYYITDRKKDMLLVNGNNVYPREIEEVIYEFPGVKEAAVIGVPDARRGERPLAYVAVVEGHRINTTDLIRFLRQRLADYKQPREIRLIDALPRNATGKILKTQLRQQTAG
jgi:long-chain acyl-CoA synthetase